MPFEILVPKGSAPVTSRLHCINPILAKEVDTTLNQYLDARLIQHSTSSYSSALVVVPNKFGGVQIDFKLVVAKGHPGCIPGVFIICFLS